MKNNNLILYAAILIFGVVSPFIFPAFKVQLSILCILIVLAMTWNIQGGEMGYNTFGNILFYGMGMYLCASVQVGMFFPLAEWTAIGTLGLGVAAGEISGGIEIIGAGQGFTTPPFPNIGSTELRGEFFYFLSFVLLVLTFIFVKWIYSTRFRLVLNAIRDNEDKAEAMGIQTMRYKIVGWMVSAFFCGLAGGIMGGLVGYIDSTDVAFDGREMGVFMVLMAILGGKGTLWGPIIGATLFHIFKEGFWTFFLGWQYVALGVLIVVIVIYFPEGLMGWLREKYPERFGEIVDEADRKAQVELK